MNLTLTRPLIFFDIEATGLSVSNDRIVELCYIKLFPDGHEETRTERFNPEMHISAEATAVNGICDADVQQCPTFKARAQALHAVFTDCDIAGFNSNFFDVPMLVEEFFRAGIDLDLTHVRLVDVQNIYHKMERRNLSAAYKFYCDKDLENAHTALADTRATLEVLDAQVGRYAELTGNVAFLADFSRRGNNVDLAGRIVRNEQGVEVINFGKYRGQAVADVLRRDPGYYGWIMQGDFTRDTKNAFTRIRLRSLGA